MSGLEKSVDCPTKSAIPACNGAESLWRVRILSLVDSQDPRTEFGVRATVAIAIGQLTSEAGQGFSAS